MRDGVYLVEFLYCQVSGELRTTTRSSLSKAVADSKRFKATDITEYDPTFLIPVELL